MAPLAADEGFPTAGGYQEAAETPSIARAAGGGAPAVEFGWGDDRKLTGRRRKAEASKKAKPGSFGARSAARQSRSPEPVSYICCHLASAGSKTSGASCPGA